MLRGRKTDAQAPKRVKDQIFDLGAQVIRLAGETARAAGGKHTTLARLNGTEEDRTDEREYARDVHRDGPGGF